MADKEPDIYKRSYNFSCQLIKTVKVLPSDQISKIMISQLIRSGTSISANLYEAKYAASRKDFINKVAISLKETRETIYWMQILQDTGYANHVLKELSAECTELLKILSSIKLNSQSPTPA